MAKQDNSSSSNQSSLRQLANIQASYINGREKGLVNHEIRTLWRR